MACTSYGELTKRPITRKQTEVWLIGQVLSKLNATKLPSKNEVLALLFQYKQTEKEKGEECMSCHCRRHIKSMEKSSYTSKVTQAFC